MTKTVKPKRSPKKRQRINQVEFVALYDSMSRAELAEHFGVKPQAITDMANKLRMSRSARNKDAKRGVARKAAVFKFKKYEKFVVQDRNFFMASEGHLGMVETVLQAIKTMLETKNELDPKLVELFYKGVEVYAKASETRLKLHKEYALTQETELLNKTFRQFFESLPPDMKGRFVELWEQNLKSVSGGAGGDFVLEAARSLQS